MLDSTLFVAVAASEVEPSPFSVPNTRISSEVSIPFEPVTGSNVVLNHPILIYRCRVPLSFSTARAAAEILNNATVFSYIC